MKLRIQVIADDGAIYSGEAILKREVGRRGKTKSVTAELRPQGGRAQGRVGPESGGDGHHITEIVSLVKDCDEAEVIESQILDRTSQVNRVLLPLYVVHKHLRDRFRLTSGDINRVTTELGVPVSIPNVSHVLAGTASKYVIGDTVRKKGSPVPYRLSRRGVKYMESVIRGRSDAD